MKTVYNTFNQVTHLRLSQADISHSITTVGKKDYHQYPSNKSNPSVVQLYGKHRIKIHFCVANTIN